ncbi:MAG: hypothetical protein Edafosvirus34_1, partial [Edafosvirus sp.]
KAIICLLKAIEKECNMALLDLAIYYQDQKNVIKAEEYYLKAIEKGIDGALYNIANFYSELEGEDNFRKAEKYYLMSIDKGHTDALNNLGYLYYFSNNVKLAEKYFLKAIENNNKNAIYNLANLYSEKKYDPNENIDWQKKAEEYYFKAIMDGNNHALNNLAIMYSSQNNISDAVKYFSLAWYFLNDDKIKLACEKQICILCKTNNPNPIINKHIVNNEMELVDLFN